VILQQYRPRGRLNRDRLKQGLPLLFMDERDVVKGVNEIQAPQRIGLRLAGGEDVPAAQRPRVQKLGPGVVDQFILDLILDRLAAAGDALHHALRFASPQRGVEQHQLAHARHAVVARHDRGETVGVAGNGARVEERVGPVTVATVQLALSGAVGIQSEEQA